MGDTDLTADAGKTSASRQTFVSGKRGRARRRAICAQQILRRANAGAGCDDRARRWPRSIAARRRASTRIDLARSPTDARRRRAARRGHASIRRPRRSTRTARACPTPPMASPRRWPRSRSMSSSARSRCCACVAAHDVGRAINPTQVEGQIHGGIAQGLGLALMEEYLPGRTENLHDYLIPTVGDMPRDRSTILIEDARAARPVRRQGRRRAGADPDRAGDPRRASDHATGVRITRVPATPDRVRRRLEARRSASHDRHDAKHRRRDAATASCAAMPARCCATSGRARPAPATAMPMSTASSSRVDPVVLFAEVATATRSPFLGRRTGTASSLRPSDVFVTGIGAGTTYPDYKPAPFIVVAQGRGRRHGHRRDRGHLQLLRRQGEDRHRPLSRAGAGGGARRRASRSAT